MLEEEEVPPNNPETPGVSVFVAVDDVPKLKEGFGAVDAVEPNKLDPSGAFEVEGALELGAPKSDCVAAGLGAPNNEVG